MLFYDQEGLVIDVTSLLSISKYQTRNDIGEVTFGVCFVTKQGANISVSYDSIETARKNFEVCRMMWQEAIQRQESFDKDMQEHARKGMRYQEKRAEEEDKGW